VGDAHGQLLRREPRGASTFRPLSYVRLREVLRSTLRNATTAAAGRHLAEDYVRTLEREFS
jgi:hypothetical protein